MKNTKRLSVIAIVLILVGVVGSLLTFSLRDKPSSVSEEQVIDNQNIKEIEISTNNEEVELISTTDSKIEVKISGRSSKDIKDRINVGVTGNTLSIQKVESMKKLFDINFFGQSLEVTVSLPEKVYESLQVEIDNGSFQAEQLNIKDVQANTANGHIELSNITATTLKVDSKNGNIYLDNVEGNITGKTANGLLSLSTSNLDRNIELESANGDIEIQTEKEPTNTIFDIKVDNGEATIFGNSNWNTVVGNGDNLIKLTTANGNITVTK